MTSPPRRSPATLLMTCAVPVAAMLSFAVQPMMGKRLLPIYGGSAATWLGAMVYFQLALLLGYGWATWLLTKPPGFQRRATLALAVLAIASFRLPGLDTAAGGIPRIVWILSLHSLPAMMLLFSISPLMHGWLQRRGEQVPYHLYAFSNLGSLIGLVSYPFLIEPAIGIGAQRWIVHAGIVLVAALLGGAIALEKSDPAGAPKPAAPAPSGAEPSIPLAETRRAAEATSLRIMTSWFGLSLVTCVAMLGATELLAAEVGSSPLAWVGPFGVYLLSFTIVFSGIWRPWMTAAAITALVFSLTAFMFYKGPGVEPLFGGAFYSLMFGVASTSLVGNALLYRLRPAMRFDRYYLVIAAGGVAGGLLASVVLPHVLAMPIEFIVASALLLFWAVLATVAAREPGTLIAAGALAIVPLIGVGYRTLRDESPNAEIRHYRNAYGHMFTRTRSREGESRVEMLSETTIHGTQVRVDSVSPLRPTFYYTESGGAGRTILHLRSSHPAMRIGVIGLGVGTLAAYGRPEDEIRFWDIDPKAIQIANNEFTYLRDSKAQMQVFQADGRHGLAASTEDFDVIVVDAFSGDSVPAHLITVEALRIYFARLEARKGTLVIHVSSRYNEAFPVLSNTALAAGRQAYGVITQINDRGENSDWDSADTEYVIIPSADLLAAFNDVFPESEENGRVKRRILTHASTTPEPKLVWTDDRHAAIEMIVLRKFLIWGIW